MPVYAAALFVLLFCAVFSKVVLDGIPHIEDEAVYVFQAKIFNLGRLTVDSPCVPEAFVFPHVINNGKWYGQYPPGYPLLLMPWVALGIPWLLNPVLASLFVILVYLLGTEIFSRRVGILTALLAAASIWYLVQSSTMMAHTSGMFFTGMFLLGFFRWMRSPRLGNALLLSFGLGMGLLIRPLSVFFLAIPFGLMGLKTFSAAPKRHLRSVAAISAVIGIFVLTFMVYNQKTNGSAFTSGYTVRYGKDVGYGFGKTGYTDTPHSLHRGLENVVVNLKSLNAYLFGWPLTSFWLLLPLVIHWRKERHFARTNLLLASSFGLLVIGYMGYWSFAAYAGPRFLFEGIHIPLLLSAKGLDVALSRSRRIRSRAKVPVFAGLTAAFLAHSFLVVLPQFVDPQGLERRRKMDADFHGVTNGLHKALLDLEVHNALVLVNMMYTPVTFLEGKWWGSGFIHNDPLLRGDIIYASAKPGTFDDLRDCFPERRLFLYTGTLRKGLLMPLSLHHDEWRSGQPMRRKHEGENDLRLLSSPSDLFMCYSQEFRTFLGEFTANVGLVKLNIPLLVKEGRNLKSQGRVLEAAFLFEAALQLEIEKNARFTILNELVPCYLEMGNAQDAWKINAALIDMDRSSLHNIVPDKGF